MAERDQQLLALATRVDELESMIEGLAAYIAITSPSGLVEAEDAATQDFVRSQSAGEARSIRSLIETQIGLKSPTRTGAGHGASQVLYMIERIRESGQKSGLRMNEPTA